MDVSDEEVVEREQKLEAGEIEEISHDEFVRRVRRRTRPMRVTYNALVQKDANGILKRYDT